ncbi:hypothetical protein N7534_011903, partial [Penicillium rubens]
KAYISYKKGNSPFSSYRIVFLASILLKAPNILVYTDRPLYTGKKKASKEKGRAISPSKASINPITIPPAKDKGKGKAILASASLAKASSAITTPSKSIKKRTASDAPSGKDKGS